MVADEEKEVGALLEEIKSLGARYELLQVKRLRIEGEQRELERRRREISDRITLLRNKSAATRELPMGAAIFRKLLEDSVVRANAPETTNEQRGQYLALIEKARIALVLECPHPLVLMFCGGLGEPLGPGDMSEDRVCALCGLVNGERRGAYETLGDSENRMKKWHSNFGDKRIPARQFYLLPTQTIREFFATE